MVEAVEAISIKVEEDKQVGLTKVTQTFGKQPETLEEPSEEGEAFVPNKVDKSSPSLATTVVESTTMKKSAKRKEVSQCPQVGKSPTMPPSPNSKTMEACSS